MKNVLIAAPIDYLHVNDNWDEVVLIDPDDTASVSLWNIFMNGELISTIDGDDKPTFDELVRLFLTYLNN